MLSGRVLLLETGFVRLGHPQQTLYWSWRMMTDFRLRQAEAAAEAEKIEARYSDADLLRLIREHGLEESSSAAPEVSAQAGEA